MLRSFRALLLFWTIILSYAWEWVLARLISEQRSDERYARAHLRNARRLAEGFARLRGVFIKMGQVLSVVGTFLPTAFGEALETLQDKVPPRPFSEIEGRLREAFGPDPLARFGSFEREALAAASLAQVHRATTRDGRAIAVKILYPGIEQLIVRDLAVLRSLLPFIKLVVKVGRVERVFHELGAMLARETDYQHERSNMDRIRNIFASQSDVIVPEVIDELTAGGVLSMSFEAGAKINDLDAQLEQGTDSEAIAKLLVECYFTMLLEHRVFHADPHPGNFLVRPGPKLVILDYGAVEELTEALSSGMKIVILGAITRNDDQILAGLEKMGFIAESGDRDLLKQVGREYLKVLSSVKIENFSKLDRQTMEKLSGYEQIRGRLRAVMKSVEYPEGYFYVERTLALLFGLVAQLSPKLGLPGLAMPLATKLFMKGFVTPTAPTKTEPAA